MREILPSVGIDIGTSTTQVIFSKLEIDNTSGFGAIPKIEIVSKEIIYESPVYTTPLRNEWEIDAEQVKKILFHEYEQAGIKPEELATGAVIITGESVKKKNAGCTAKQLSEIAGDFVVVTAGPDLESVLAGCGSGAAKLSEICGGLVANLDIGGGTTNICIFENGKVIDTACLDIGGRLIRIEDETIQYMSESIVKISTDIKSSLVVGAEYVYDTKELIRAGLEDVFCGHMHGLPMGCDVCYTNHMPTDQNDIESLAVILASAGCHYIIGVPGGDDIMLMYQSTGYQDIASIREILGKRPIPEFEAWLEKRGIWKDGHLGENAGDSGVFGEDLNMLKQMTPARIGIGRAGARYQTVPYLNFLADQAAASDAVFAEVTEETLGALGKFGCFEVKSLCSDKIEMLTRPDWGRKLSEKSLREIAANCEKEVDVQIYFGDGLCAPSIQANAEDLFLTLKAGLEEESLTVGTPFFVRYCRVNTTRQIGELLKPKVVCLLIGERPGLLTSESMSAYISYNPSRKMSESDYTVVANISKHGVPPVEAGAHIVEIIQDMIRYKCSGVKLSKKLSDCT